MESLIKQINFHVKGREMFWDDPKETESILHLRAAALSEDERMADYLSRGPACPSVRRPPTTRHRNINSLGRQVNQKRCLDDSERLPMTLRKFKTLNRSRLKTTKSVPAKLQSDQ